MIFLSLMDWTISFVCIWPRLLHSLDIALHTALLILNKVSILKHCHELCTTGPECFKSDSEYSQNCPDDQLRNLLVEACNCCVWGISKAQAVPEPFTQDEWILQITYLVLQNGLVCFYEGHHPPPPPSDMEQTKTFDVAINVSRPTIFTMHERQDLWVHTATTGIPTPKFHHRGMHPIDFCITWILIYHPFVHIIKIVQGNGHSLCEHVTVTMLVLPEFDSEPRFKPELLWTWPKSSPKFKDGKNRMGNWVNH